VCVFGSVGREYICNPEEMQVKIPLDEFISVLATDYTNFGD
jgi:hypothetical protein